jgi:outer membrane lipoprotein-sorting protein
MVTLPVTGEVAYLSRDNLYVWQGQAPSQPQYYRVWFEPYNLHPVRFDLEEPAGRPVLQVTYEDLQQVGGLTLPQRITIVQPLADRRVVWHYSEMHLNPGVTPALFRMQVPRGTERLELEEAREQDYLALPRTP